MLSVDGRVIVQAEAVHKSFGHNHVLRGFDLAVREKEVVVIIGPSGSGKSTFLRCLNGLEPIDEGRIDVAGCRIGYREDRRGKQHIAGDREVAKQRRRIGMVFQQFNLFSHLTALENITVAPIHVLGKAADEARADAMRLLREVGLADKAQAFPAHLSGGQKQRVAIARALAMHPKVIMFDEATSALDPEMIKEVLDVMMDLARGGMTMLVVTHEMGFARACADRVVFVDEGVVVEEAPPDSFFSAPKTERLRSFLDRIL